jgi:pimeloyl-ACP methyl ester carboxylesterase
MLAAVAVFSVLTAPTAAQSILDEYVDMGGYRLHFRVARPQLASTGVPTIVLEAGGGTDSRYWAALQPRLAADFGAVVVAYDRTGLGQSDLSMAPYDIRQVATDLRKGLTHLGLERNVLLVGHSFGGMIIQMYAAKYQESVRGLLFMDPNMPTASAPYRQWRATLPPVPPELADPKTRADSANKRELLAIYENMTTVFVEGSVPPDIPAVVISAERGFFGQERLARAFILSHQLLAASFANGEWRLARGAGHSILPQGTEVVVESLAGLLRSSRAR